MSVNLTGRLLQTNDQQLGKIAKKILDGGRIDAAEAVYLYKHGELGFLGSLANFIREKKNGNKVYFNHNFHVEPTNVCVYSCSFCSYSRLIKHRSEGWELSVEQIMDIVRGYDDKDVTEIHITGG